MERMMKLLTRWTVFEGAVNDVLVDETGTTLAVGTAHGAVSLYAIE